MHGNRSPANVGQQCAWREGPYTVLNPLLFARPMTRSFFFNPQGRLHPSIPYLSVSMRVKMRFTSSLFLVA